MIYSAYLQGRANEFRAVREAVRRAQALASDATVDFEVHQPLTDADHVLTVKIDAWERDAHDAEREELAAIDANIDAQEQDTLRGPRKDPMSPSLAALAEEERREFWDGEARNAH